MNYKRVERLYRLEGLAVRRRSRKRLAVPRVPRPLVKAPNEMWSIDFVSDGRSSGRRFRCSTLIDACTRESPTITVAFSLPSTAVIAALESVIATRGQPARLPLDNGSKFRRGAFDEWAANRGIELLFGQPGKPTQNSHMETSDGRPRDECLNQHWFPSLRDAQLQIERWRQGYLTDRPHIALHPLTPREFARTFPSPTARLSV